MHRDTDQAPASPALLSGRRVLLVWIALGLGSWLLLATIAFVAYLAFTRLV